MAQSAQQLAEQLADKIKRAGTSAEAPVVELKGSDLGPALELLQSPWVVEQRNLAKQAFKAVIATHDAQVIAQAVRYADESLLVSMHDYVLNQGVPFFDANVISELDGLIQDHSLSPQRRLQAAQLLHCHANLHPEYYGRIVAVLGARLQDAENNPAKVNAELVDTCVNVHADELMPAIEKVFASGNVQHPTYTTAEAVHDAMHVPTTAFEQGLELFMVTKELDEVRHDIDELIQQRLTSRDAAQAEQDLPLSHLGELDGFLHALATSPVPVARSLWVEQLSACLLHALDSDESREQCLEKVTTYYAQVKDAMTVGEAEPHFEGAYATGVSHMQSMQPWARGYLLGLELWQADERAQAESFDSFAELQEFLQALAQDQSLPEQYQSMANSDYAMIVQLMTQRVFSDLHDTLNDSFDADEDDLQGFFDNFN